MDFSVPSIKEASDERFSNMALIVTGGDPETAKTYLIKKSAVIGMSVGSKYLLIYIKHFEGNSIELPFTPQTKKQLVKDAAKVLFAIT
jgi:hypothetical protein